MPFGLYISAYCYFWRYLLSVLLVAESDFAESK